MYYCMAFVIHHAFARKIIILYYNKSPHTVKDARYNSPGGGGGLRQISHMAVYWGYPWIFHSAHIYEVKVVFIR